MYDTSGTRSVCYASHIDYDILARVNWLKGELAREAKRPLPSRRRLDEETRPLRLLNPVTTEDAYAWFGTLLGLFPPAAIFGRLFGYGLDRKGSVAIFLLLLAMNGVCCAVGRKMGRQLGAGFGDPRVVGWPLMVLLPLLWGLIWGLITGAAGGLLFFGIGAFFGAFSAIPVAVAGFYLFAPLHRLLARDGMIEERHLWPLAFGVTCFIAALIASPNVFK
jgi:hypothetical protein